MKPMVAKLMTIPLVFSSLCCIPKPSPNFQGIISIVAAQTVETVFRVSSTSPTNGETNVNRGSAIVIDFSRDVNASSVTQSIGFVPPNNSTSISSLTQQNTSARRITLRPNNVFDAGGTYTLTVRNTVRDTTGQALTENFTFSFTAAQ